MKRMFAVLYAAFPAVMLFAQTLPPERLPDGVFPGSLPPARMLSGMPKSFPPDVVSSPAGPRVVKSPRGNCVYPDPIGKSLSVKRCDAAPQRLRLVSPFKPAAAKKPAKQPSVPG